jgi:hypothetical protein
VNSEQLKISVFVELSTDLTMGAAEEVSRLVMKRFGEVNVTVVIRSDEWFIEYGGYPEINPFLPVEILPSYAEFARTSTYYCSQQVEMRCMKFGLMNPVLGYR